MAQLDIMLYSNKQNKQINSDDIKIISGEHNATSIYVHFPEEYTDYSKRVDFLNVRNEKGTVPLYIPEDETMSYSENFDKLNFSFMLPSAATTNGEILIQFIAYKADDSEAFVPFEIIKLSVEQSVLYVKKNASNNPDLILMAYQQSNLALGIARESLEQTANAERAALEAERLAGIATQAVIESAASAGESSLRALDAEEAARQAAGWAQQAVEQTGTKVKIGENTLMELIFISDPQTQIDFLKTTMNSTDAQNVKIIGNQNIAGNKTFAGQVDCNGTLRSKGLSVATIRTGSAVPDTLEENTIFFLI